MSSIKSSGSKAFILFLFMTTSGYSNLGLANWYCEGGCHVLENVYKNYGGCSRIEQEACERDRGYWHGVGEMYSCTCAFRRESEHRISAAEPSEWLARNELTKQCEDKKNPGENKYYSQKNVICRN